jgi:VWFA-related protein
MRLSRVLLPAILILAAIPIAYSQQVKETTTVEVVQIPVYVTSSGASVRGLTRDDFKLRVNGRRQQIDYFDVVDFKSLSSDQMRDPRQRRLYVLTFDLANPAPFATLRAKHAAEQYLTNAQPSDYFAIALLNRGGNVEFIVPFTRDQAALRRAVSSFNAASPGDPLRLTVAFDQRAALSDASQIRDLRTMSGGLAAELVADGARSRVADQFESLGLLAKRLAPLEGYKHVVLLSTGFESYLLTSTISHLNSGFPYGGLRSEEMQQVTQLQPREERNFIGFDARLLEMQRRMHERFAAAGVFLDAVDIAGLRPPGMISNETLHFVIADTGGQVVEHRNNLRAAIQRLTDSQQVVYVLGFHAPAGSRKENTVSVDVNGAPRFSYVSYRESYSTIADKPSTSDALHLADIVTNDIPQNGITMTTEVKATAKKAELTIKLPGQELLAIAGDDATVKGEALMYVFAGQTAAAYARKDIEVDVTRARTSGLGGGDVEMTQSFDLPPGTYALKVLVRFKGHDTLAFARKDFTVGE